MSSPTLVPPLADYFWIAGIDSVSYGEHLNQDSKPSRKSFTDQLLVAIEAEEESHLGSESLLVPNTNGGPSPRRGNGSPVSSSAASRMSAASATIDEYPSAPHDSLMRNGSSSSDSTITEASIINTSGNTSTFSSINGVRKDFDFDKALLKFAAERDSFLEDLSFSAGTVVPSKPLVHPRATMVVNEDQKLEKTNSLRRRISLRELTSMRRSPSAVGRACKSLSRSVGAAGLLTVM